MELDLGPRIDEMLRAFGHTPLEYKGWRTLADGLPGFRGVLRAALPDHPTVAQADFEIMLPGGAVVVESYGVLGADAEARATAAIDKLAQGTLQVVLSQQGDAQATEQVEQQTLEGADGRTWTLSASRWQLVAFDDEVETPDSVLDALRPLVQARLTDAGPHWFRIMRTQVTEQAGTEVLWDNGRWSEAEGELGTQSWPNRRQTARCFVLVAPTPDGG